MVPALLALGTRADASLSSMSERPWFARPTGFVISFVLVCAHSSALYSVLVFACVLPPLALP